MPSVSLCMIVCNEEEHLEPCLRSAMPYADEIIVVDTGSADRTGDIALELGAKLFRYKWNDHFGEARNFALGRARGDWILVMDADERLHPCESVDFERLLQDDSAAGYTVTIRQHRSERQEDYETDSVCRLFRNLPGLQYRGRIHEDIGVALSLLSPGLQIKGSPLVLSHYGYLQDAAETRDKAARNRRLLERAVREESDACYYRYAIGVEDFLAGDYAKAAQALEQLLPLVPPSAGYAPDLAYKLAYSHWRTGRLREALQAAEAGLVRSPSHYGLRELHGILLLEDGRPEQALHSLRMNADGRRDDTVEQEAQRLYWLGMVHQQLGNWQKAAGCLQRSAALSPVCRDRAVSAWLELAVLQWSADEVTAAWAKPLPDLSRATVLPLAAPYAMKWGRGKDYLPLLEKAVLEIAPGEGRRLAFFRAVLLSQNGSTEEAYRLLEELIAVQKERHLILYLWALSNSGNPEWVQLNTLQQHRAEYPELGALADVLLGGAAGSPPASALCSQAAYAMLMMGAWSGFLLVWRVIQSLYPASGAGAFPADWRPAVMRGPLEIRRAVLDTMVNAKAPLALGDRLFAALLSYATGDKAGSLRLLEEAKKACPERLEPRIGLYEVLRGAAEPLPFLLLTSP